jgi:hypothetical protein
LLRVRWFLCPGAAMPTPISSATAYCSPAQLMTFYDARQIGDLLQDKDRRVPEPLLTSDPNVLNALNWASGELESACIVGNKYKIADLQALTGMSAANLQGLVADLAFWKLRCRRYPDASMTDAAKWAFEKLERLRKGEAIFGLQDQASAGDPDTLFMQQADYDTLGLTTDQASRFFGLRAKISRLQP